MIELTKCLISTVPVHTTVTLTYEQRTKSRLRTRTDRGDEVGLFQPRGQILRTGDRLQSEAGDFCVEVRAAAETVSRVSGGDLLTRARACYHLGNRHVALQITETELYYLHDHVLDDLVRQLGLIVTVDALPFEPEIGAYGGSGHFAAGHHPH